MIYKHEARERERVNIHTDDLLLFPTRPQGQLQLGNNGESYRSQVEPTVCYHSEMNNVTRILSAIENGNATAADQLLPIVYDELRKLAAAKLANEEPGQTIQATGLVHEAWMRLLGSDAEIHWNGRGHFFGAAAKAMQRILVENARRKKSLKAGGEFDRVQLSQVVHEVRSKTRDVDVIEVDEALEKLAAIEPRKAELVRLRFFAGLTLAEAARALGVSGSTADNDWAYAKAWLRVEMAESD